VECATACLDHEDADGEAFLAAGHAQLTYTRTNFEIAIDGERWVIGFVQGAPFRRTDTIARR
jgi:hypothetical protein